MQDDALVVGTYNLQIGGPYPTEVDCCTSCPCESSASSSSSSSTPGVAKVHYTTYNIPDNIAIYAQSAPGQCDDPPSGFLWTSNCVSTAAGNGPGNAGGDFPQGKVDSFSYAPGDLPLVASVIPDCGASDPGTLWCVRVYDDTGTIILDYCGDETGLCTASSSSSSSYYQGFGGGQLFVDALATEEELTLTYDELVDKKVKEFYESNPIIFEGKTNEEKEEIILDLVEEGELFTDVAIKIAEKEGLDVE
jgi:hypothetical protein